MKKFISIAVSLLAIQFICPGQNPWRNGMMPMSERMFNGAVIQGAVVLSPEDEGGEEIPGVGVTIVAISLEGEKQDTTFTVAGDKGKFFMPGIKPGKVRVTFSMMGYEEISNVVKLEQGMNKVVANLKPVKELLNAAVVKEVVEPLSIKADTLVFNASAVKTEKGEMAIDILEQMPGVEVSGNNVKVLDETVSQVYVDGAILFGNAPMKALNNISADDVVKIKSYQEYANKDPNHKTSKTESKQRVLDIETRSKVKKVLSVNTVAGGGFDTDSTYHKFRYTTGGTVNVNSQNVNVAVSVNMNNINNGENGRRGMAFQRGPRGGGSADLRQISASAQVQRSWWSKEARNFQLGSIVAKYDFNNSFTIDESRSKSVYFANEKYNSRETETSSYSDNRSFNHNFMIFGSKSLKDGSLNATASLNLDSNESNSRYSSYNRQDDLAPQGTANGIRNSGSGYSSNVTLIGDKGFKDKIRVGLYVDYGMSDSDGAKVKTDTTTSTLTRQVLNIDSQRGSHRFGIRPGISYIFNDHQTLSMSYTFSDSYSQTDQLAFDVTDIDNPAEDVVNTQHLTNANNTHTANLSYSHYFEKIKAKMEVGLTFESVGLDKLETYPETDHYDHRFNSLSPTLNMGNDSMLDRWSFNYSMTSGAPSLEMIRPRLDNSNLYSVSVGNPSLRQSRHHNLNLSYTSAVGKEIRSTLKAQERGDFTAQVSHVSTLILTGGGRINTDVIANRRTYFAEPTMLSDYGYMMPAQSTLSTFENVDNSYSAYAMLRYETQITPIMCIVSAATNFNWDDSPAFVNDKLTRTDNFSPSVNLSLRSNFSKKVKLFIIGSGSYIYSHNSEKDKTSYFRENLITSGEVNKILKHYYIGGAYNKSFTQGLSYNRIDDNVLDLTIGGRFGPKNNFNLSINVHDVFNKSSGFSTSMSSDFVSYNWNHQFGRYVMFTLFYKMNQRNGGQGR